MYIPPNPSPFLTVLSYSGGVQSHALTLLVVRGKIKRPERLLVVSADPGWENPETYKFRDRMLAECEKEGVDAMVVEGPKLLDDLAAVKAGEKGRWDTPALYTIGVKGKRGQIKQGCTKHYKIAPIDRAVRKYLKEKYSVGVPKENTIEHWIGFAWDERERCKPMPQKYKQVRWPFIEMRICKADLVAWYKANNEPMPPRSVCEGCWANAPGHYRKMAEERPEEWARVKQYDRDIRDLTSIGIKQEAFVSDTLLPLEVLEQQGFSTGNKENDDRLSCDSGFCFI